MEDIKKIVAPEGKIFKRIHDGILMGKEIFLGYDFSTGIKREDREEYYELVDESEDTRKKE